MESVPQLILIFLLILLNAFFAAAEYSLVAVRKSRIDDLVKKGDSLARLVQRVLEDRGSFISTIQLGVTVVSLILGWVGEPLIAQKISSLFTFLPNGQISIIVHTISVVIALVLLTFLSLILGELVPKTIALQKTEMVSLITIAPLFLFAKIFQPFIKFINLSGRIVLRLLGLSSSAGEDQLTYTKDEIKAVLEQIKQSGIVSKEDAEMVQNAFGLGDIQIKKLMIPRADIVAFNVNTAISDLIKKIEQHPHSRFPVYKNSIDEISGFIHVKDVYQLLLKKEHRKKLKQTDLVRKIINVPATKKANEVLLDMRKKHVHLAVVNDEFGQTEGIVTLEDIIESLVGEIQDEFDKPLKEIQRQSDGSYLIDGNTSVELVQRRFKLPLKGQGYTTIGGLVFGLLGREPRLEDKVQIGSNIFKLEVVEGKRIKTLKLDKETKK
jgi:CBS domain containing-hemolysin-like protein